MKKDIDALSNRRQYISLALGLLLAGLAVVLMCSWLVGQLSKVTRKEVNRYLGEISENTAMTIDSRMGMTFQILDSTGETYLSVLEGSKEAMSGYLSRQAEIHKFTWLSIVLNDGTVICSDSHEEYETDIHSSIVEAEAGKRTVMRLKASAEGGRSGIVYADPLYSKGELIGAVVAWCDVNSIREALSIDTLEGEGFSLIVDLNGNYVVGSSNKNAYTSASNFFDVINKSGVQRGETSLSAMQSMMHRHETGSMKYALTDGVEKSVHFAPLKYDDLYLLMVIPVKAASQSINTMVRQSIFIVIVVVLMFLLLTLYTFYSSVRSQKKMKDLAFRDPITGGISKLLFDLEAEKLIRLAPPGAYQFISLNIQKFKLINDNFGQENGDRVLRHVHNTIADLLVSGELITRDSADNFYILTKTRTKEAQEAVFRLYSERINDYNNNAKKKYFINISLGVVLVEDPTLSFVQIRDRANLARKNSKQAYGELYSFVFYSDIERLQMIKEKDMENRMNDALREGEFLVYLQPKIEPKHNRVRGAEALVRWQTRDGEFIMPNDFIPFFERNGFIVKLDLYVFEETCALIRSWIDCGVKPVTVSVNMSRAHLMNPDFLEQYKEIVKKYDIPANLLEIELTESLVFENLDALIEVINKIHEAGFMCALDDFGSGYSSLSMLADICVDSLKLDKAFWKSGHDGERAHDVIAMVMELGKRLNMVTISEGVETTSQLGFLRNIQCDLVQGYVFSKPVPASEFEMLAFGKIITEKTSQVR